MSQNDPAQMRIGRQIKQRFRVEATEALEPVAVTDRGNPVMRWMEDSIGLRMRLERRLGGFRLAVILAFGYGGIAMMGLAPAIRPDHWDLYPWQLLAPLAAIAVLVLVGRSRRRALAALLPDGDTGNGDTGDDDAAAVHRRHDNRHLMLAGAFGVIGFGFMLFLELDQQRADAARAAAESREVYVPPEGTILIDNSPQARPQR